jgi:hypothetical protein
MEAEGSKITVDSKRRRTYRRKLNGRFESVSKRIYHKDNKGKFAKYVRRNEPTHL